MVEYTIRVDFVSVVYVPTQPYAPTATQYSPVAATAAAVTPSPTPITPTLPPASTTHAPQKEGLLTNH